MYPSHTKYRRHSGERGWKTEAYHGPRSETVVFIEREPELLRPVSGRRREQLTVVLIGLAGIGVSTLWSLLLATLEMALKQ